MKLHKNNSEISILNANRHFCSHYVHHQSSQGSSSCVRYCGPAGFRPLFLPFVKIFSDVAKKDQVGQITKSWLNPTWERRCHRNSIWGLAGELSLTEDGTVGACEGLVRITVLNDREWLTLGVGRAVGWG